MFKARIKADSLKEFIGTVGSLVDEAKINVSEDGLQVKAVDPSHVAMIESNLMKSARAYEVLEQLEISHMANNLASELSGGQSKLVDIGRSMMGEPKLLLLDEPVAGVAGPLAMKIFANLRNLVDDTGISVLIIEHNMDFILRQGVDRIIVMNEGEVLMIGTPDEVKGSKEVISAYLGSSEDWEWEKLAQEDD